MFWVLIVVVVLCAVFVMAYFTHLFERWRQEWLSRIKFLPPSERLSEKEIEGMSSAQLVEKLEVECHHNGTADALIILVGGKDCRDIWEDTFRNKANLGYEIRRRLKEAEGVASAVVSEKKK